MLIYGVACKSCLTAIWSKYRHDYHTCSCGEIFIDGGREYLRYGTLCETQEPEIIIIDSKDNSIYQINRFSVYKVEENIQEPKRKRLSSRLPNFQNIAKE